MYFIGIFKMRVSAKQATKKIGGKSLENLVICETSGYQQLKQLKRTSQELVIYLDESTLSIFTKFCVNGFCLLVLIVLLLGVILGIFGSFFQMDWTEYNQYLEAGISLRWEDQVFLMLQKSLALVMAVLAI